MSKIDALFKDLRRDGRKAFMPFITAGDPDLDFTKSIIQELDRRGCHMCEIGIPYSDPIADGPVIQASYTRALGNSIKLEQIFQMVAEVAPQVSMPLVTMVSYAIIFRHGPEAYVKHAKKAGVAGAIVPDLLAEEAPAFAEICQREDFSLIQLVTPMTPRERALKIAAVSTGFLYYVSVVGITGERTSLPPELVENVAWLRSQTELPICIGFGISQPDHVKLLGPVSDGLIVGSAIVKRVAQAEEAGKEATVESIGQYVDELMSALN